MFLCLAEDVVCFVRREKTSDISSSQAVKLLTNSIKFISVSVVCIACKEQKSPLAPATDVGIAHQSNKLGSAQLFVAIYDHLHRPSLVYGHCTHSQLIAITFFFAVLCTIALLCILVFITNRSCFSK